MPKKASFCGAEWYVSAHFCVPYSMLLIKRYLFIYNLRLWQEFHNEVLHYCHPTKTNTTFTYNLLKQETNQNETSEWPIL